MMKLVYRILAVVLLIFCAPMTVWAGETPLPDEGGEPFVVASIEQWNYKRYTAAVVQGTPVAEVQAGIEAEHFTLALFDAQGNAYEKDATIAWNTDAVFTEEVGEWEVRGTLVLPEGVVLSEDVVMPWIFVIISVQAENKPEMKTYRYDGTVYQFPWVTPPGEVKNMELWVSIDGDLWRKTAWSENAYVNETGLFFTDAFFEIDRSYEMEIDYDGGDTQILMLAYGGIGQLELLWGVGGDRDPTHTEDPSVGDTDNQPAPDPPGEDDTTSVPNFGSGGPDGTTSDNTTSTPTDEGSTSAPTTSVPTVTGTTTSTPSESDEGIVKWFTEQVYADNEPSLVGYESMVGDTLTISGARLNWMANEGDLAYTFGWNDVSVTLPATLIAQLDLAANELMTLTLTRTDTQFSVAVTARGETITTLGETMVRLPIAEGCYALQLGENEMDDIIEVDQAQVATFFIYETGDYRLKAVGVDGVEQTSTTTTQTQTEEEEQLEEEAQPTLHWIDFLPISVVGVLGLMIGGIVWWRKRK